MIRVTSRKQIISPHTFLFQIMVEKIHSKQE